MINDPALYTQDMRIKSSLLYPLFESKHVSSPNDTQWERRVWGAIINHGTVTGPGFQVGELFYETLSDGTTKTGKRGYITNSTGTQIKYDTTHSSMPIGGSNNDFTDGNKIIGQTSGSVATITDHDTGTHHYYDYYTSSVRMKVGTAQGDRAVSHSVRIIPYFSGFEPVIQMTYDAEPMENRDFYFLFGNRTNGIGLWLNGLTPYVVVISNVSGTPKIVHKVEQSKWEEGKGIDFRFAQIQKVVFKWLGYGNIAIYLVEDGQQRHLTTIKTAGKKEDVYIRTPSGSVYYEVENTGEVAAPGELRIVCSNVSAEGGDRLPGDEFTAILPMNLKRTTPATAGIHRIHAVRLRNEWPSGQPNRKTVEVIASDYSGQSKNGTLLVFHVHNVIEYTGNFVGVDDSSAVEHSIDITAVTAEHFHIIDAYDLFSGQAGKSPVPGKGITEFLTNHHRISQNFESKNSQWILICVINEIDAQPVQVSGSIKYIETE